MAALEVETMSTKTVSKNAKTMPKIEILLGDLVKADADVCVSSVHRSKNLTLGRLSGYVFQQAGETVQPQFTNEFCKVVTECCEIASDKGARSIAFPCLGTGGLKYPVEEAAAAMMAGIVDFFIKSKSQGTYLERIVIILTKRENPEFLKKFVFICAKQMHMFKAGHRAAQDVLSDADQGGYAIFIHDYEKLVSAKASRPRPTRSSSSRCRKCKL